MYLYLQTAQWQLKNFNYKAFSYDNSYDEISIKYKYVGNICAHNNVL